MNKSPKLTCALPMYRAKNIGWLALELLCHQEDIDFKWELIIIEEEEQSFGEEQIRAYEERLAKVGCITPITYIKLPIWIPLAEKWYRIAQQASNTLGFLLVAADCYSQPKRLIQTKQLLEDYEWVQSPVGPFYDLRDDVLCLYDHFQIKWHPCALNMAGRTDLIKQLPMSKRRRGIDGWMYQELVKIVGRDLKVSKNTSKDYKRGVDIHGLNNVSRDARPKLMKGWSRLAPDDRWHIPEIPSYGKIFHREGGVNPFRSSTDDEPQTIHDILPPDIVKRLLSLKEVSKVWKYSDKCLE